MHRMVFMYDLPYYNFDRFAGFARLIPRMVTALSKRLFSLSTSRMRIYPHSDLYKLAMKEGLVSENTNMINPVYYRSGPLTSNVEASVVEFMCKRYGFLEASRRLLS